MAKHFSLSMSKGPVLGNVNTKHIQGLRPSGRAGILLFHLSQYSLPFSEKGGFREQVGERSVRISRGNERMMCSECEIQPHKFHDRLWWGGALTDSNKECSLLDDLGKVNMIKIIIVYSSGR